MTDAGGNILSETSTTIRGKTVIFLIVNFFELSQKYVFHDYIAQYIPLFLNKHHAFHKK